MIVNPQIFKGGSGKLMKLKTTDYTSGSNRIDNTAVPMQPFIAGVVSGTIAANFSQGQNGIAIGTGGYVRIPFTGWGKTWRMSFTLDVDSLATSGYGYGCLWWLAGETNQSLASISVWHNTDRLYYSIGETNYSYKPEKLSEDVVDSSVPYCLEDNGFKSADIIGHQTTVTIVNDGEYVTVYVNGSARIRAAMSVVGGYSTLSMCVGAMSAQILGFSGEITDITLK